MQLAERDDDAVRTRPFRPGAEDACGAAQLAPTPRPQTGAGAPVGREASREVRNPQRVLRTIDGRFSGSELLAQLPHLRARALRLEYGPSEADDLVQDTIEKALRSWQMFQPGTNLRAWLLTIMQNLFIDRCRTRNRLAFLHEACARAARDEQLDDEPAWLSASLEDVRELAVEMPPSLSAALELVFFQGLSYAQAAGRLGVRVPTVGTRLVRARAYLRMKLQKQIAAGSPLGKYVS
jgi:RNA polymerase sigma-70 factor, ECF subfamily